MSLNRIGSIETLTDLNVRRGSDASTRPRRLSFNPFPQEWDPPQPSPNKSTDRQDFFTVETGGRGPSQEQKLLLTKQASDGPVSAFDVSLWMRYCKLSPASAKPANFRYNLVLVIQDCQQLSFARI
jgi:hypothetical protein